MKKFILKKKYLFISIVIIYIIKLSIYSVSVNEIPKEIYTGSINAEVMYKNIDFIDLKNVDTWSKEAIYETGALGIMKGYGERFFGKSDYISNEQVLAVVLRLAGLEEEAKIKSVDINLLREEGVRKNEPISLWSDGYIEVAKDNKLLSEEEFVDAFTGDQSKLDNKSFFRFRPAVRQDFAYWLAVALEIDPVYDENRIFNNYRDWRYADGDKVPYIEAILREQIMNGTGDGNFYPDGFLTREQVAQVIMNLENRILENVNVKRNNGTVEKIETSYDGKEGLIKEVLNLYIRNIKGILEKITIVDNLNGNSKYINELTGKEIIVKEDIVVYKRNKLTYSNELSVGDKIQYFYDENNIVKYIKVKNDNLEKEYILVKLNSIDTLENRINLTPLLKLNSAKNKVSLNKNVSRLKLDEDLHVVTENKPEYIYSYSDDIAIVIDGKVLKEEDLKPYTYVIATLSNKLIVNIDSVDLSDTNMEEGIVSGVVDKINIELGYINIYENKDNGEKSNKTYNFIDYGDISIVKNYKTASMEDIEAGDIIFMKLGDDGYIEEISSVSNNIIKYGKIIKKQKDYITIEFDNGIVQVFDMNKDIKITAAGRLMEYDDLKDGDYVKLKIHSSDYDSRIDELSVEIYENTVSEVYKANISYLDKLNKQLMVYNIKKLGKEKWDDDDIKGYTNIDVSDKCEYLAGDGEVDEDLVNEKFKGSEVYILVENSYGKETIKRVFIKSDKVPEIFYNDYVLDVSGSSVVLGNLDKSFEINSNSLIIKDGRVVGATSIKNNDSINIVGTSEDEELIGYILDVKSENDTSFLDIYRGRIVNIIEGVEFILESYSELDGDKWNYIEEERKFFINSNTSFVNEFGIFNSREFVVYGENSYKNKVIYTVLNGSETVLVSDAEFATGTIKGKIYKTDNTAGNKFISIWDVKELNDETYMWDEIDLEYTINVLENSVIIKNNEIIGIDKLEKDDIVKVFFNEKAADSVDGTVDENLSSNKNGIILVVDN